MDLAISQILRLQMQAAHLPARQSTVNASRQSESYFPPTPTGPSFPPPPPSSIEAAACNASSAGRSPKTSISSASGLSHAQPIQPRPCVTDSPSPSLASTPSLSFQPSPSPPTPLEIAPLDQAQCVRCKRHFNADLPSPAPALREPAEDPLTTPTTSSRIAWSRSGSVDGLDCLTPSASRIVTPARSPLYDPPHSATVPGARASRSPPRMRQMSASVSFGELHYCSACTASLESRVTTP